MNILSDEQAIKYSLWFRHFSDHDLMAHLECLNRLLATDDMLESLLVDEAIDLLDILEHECIRRFSLLVQFDHDKAKNAGL